MPSVKQERIFINLIFPNFTLERVNLGTKYFERKYEADIVCYRVVFCDMTPCGLLNTLFLPECTASQPRRQ